MPAPKVDVLCVGYACIDINFSAPHHPTPDEKIIANAMSTCGGGPASNAAVAISRLGGQARFYGYLGKDTFGYAHARELKENGVLTDALDFGISKTPVASVTIKPDGSRSVVSYRTQMAMCYEDAISLEKFPAKVLLVDGHQPSLSIKLVEEATRLGIPTILDAGSINAGTKALFNKVNYLVTSEKFARQWTNETDPEKAVQKLSTEAPFVASTWGKEGVYWHGKMGFGHTPAFKISPVDTNGAGDAFHGAFAYGVARGLPMKRNLIWSCATGALTCLKLGARTALPTRKKVDLFIREELSKVEL